MKTRWVLKWQRREGGSRNARARQVILGHQHPRLAELATSAPTLGELARNFLVQTRAPPRLEFEFLQSDEESDFKSPSAKVPVEVANCFNGEPT
eukprot:7106455-Pyramimonas_sp.AAC.1